MSVMHHHIGATVSKYRHIIVIGIALAALGSYFLPLNNFVFAGHNGNGASANTAARDAILKGHSGSSGSGSSSNSNSKPNTVTSSTNPSSSSSSSKPAKDTTFSNGNSAQIGGPGDNGNIGHNNQGKGNTGNGNNGQDNVGNFNNGGPPGQIGNFCGP